MAEDGTVKVADMGLSKLVSEATKSSSTTAGGASNPRWLAPEVLDGEHYTAAADVFSFGIVLWELLTWQLPWAEANVWTIAGTVRRGGRLPIPPLKALPGLDSQMDVASVQTFVDVMQRCWEQNTAARPNFEWVAATLRNLTN